MAVRKMVLEHNGRDVCEVVAQMVADTQSQELGEDGKFVNKFKILGPVSFVVERQYVGLFAGIFNRFVLKDSNGRWKLSVATRPGPPKYQVTGQMTVDRDRPESAKD